MKYLKAKRTIVKNKLIMNKFARLSQQMRDI